MSRPPGLKVNKMINKNDTQFLCLAIESPFQSWGTTSSGGHRRTNTIPTRSGILGMISNAARIYEKDEKLFLQKFFGLSQTCIAYGQQNELLIDYQIMSPSKVQQSGKDICCCGTYVPSLGIVHPDGTFHKENIISLKEYIQSGKFAVILETPTELVPMIEEALNCPKQPIYFGRKSCVPSRKIFVGAYTTKEEAMQAANDIYKTDKGKDIAAKYTVTELSENLIQCDIMTMNDIPISFGATRCYGARKLYRRNGMTNG